jgi:hypothetical protein
MKACNDIDYWFDEANNLDLPPDFSRWHLKDNSWKTIAHGGGTMESSHCSFTTSIYKIHEVEQSRARLRNMTS